MFHEADVAQIQRRAARANVIAYLQHREMAQ
jgi:hypothetical protein